MQAGAHAPRAHELRGAAATIIYNSFDIRIIHLYIQRMSFDIQEIHMKTAHLHDQWSSPDNSRLTSKQFSFRLPVHIAAKLAALCEIYPQKNRTHIVADLLAAALDDLEKNLPEEKGCGLDPEEQAIERHIAEQNGEDYEDIFTLGGARGRFRITANKHFKELENELGNENPTPLFEQIWRTESQIEKSKK